MAAGFEDIVETDDVALDVGVGILNAVAHTRLRSEVDNDVELMLGEEIIDQGLVGQIALNELVAYGWMLTAYRFNLLQAVFLEGNVIVIIEVVKADDGAFPHILQKAHHKVGTDETSRTGN